VHGGEQVPEGDGAGAVDGLVEDSTGRACSRSCPTTSASVWWSAPISAAVGSRPRCGASRPRARTTRSRRSERLLGIRIGRD
jgi:hypothetical protein